MSDKSCVFVRQVKDAIPLSLGPIQAAVANVRSQPWAAGVPSADSLITGCALRLDPQVPALSVQPSILSS